MADSISNLPQWGKFFTLRDERGSWSRAYDAMEFQDSNFRVEQSSVSLTTRRGTLRGLHSLHEDAGEWKLVTCVAGSVWDVVVDVRQNSASFGNYQFAELEGSNADWVLIPPGFAHGFVALTDNVALAYSMSAAYEPALEIGFRYDDPYFSIPWPIEIEQVSEKDRSFPLVKMGPK